MLKSLSLSNFDVRKLKQRDITIAVLVLTVLLGILWYFYMFNPTKERIATLETENAALQTEIEVGEAAKANLPLLEEQLAQAQADKADFLATLPTEDEVANLIETLRQSASNNSVDLTSLSQGGAGEDEVPDIRSISFNLATSGKFLNTSAFLDTLENLKRFTKVRQVGFTLEDQGILDPNLNTTYDFNVYVYTGSETADPEIASGASTSTVPGSAVAEGSVTESTASDAQNPDAGDTGETP
ncbi:MAG: type 4a pilus biogenesis protein PilO [Trueperaceae bacterium]